MGDAALHVRLVGADELAEVLGLTTEQAADMALVLASLANAGVAHVGSTVRGALLWDALQVERVRCQVVAAIRASMLGIDVGALGEQLREVLAAQASVAVERGLLRSITPALDDMDSRLDKLQEGIQGLFRQQGDNGQKLRDLVGLCGTFVADMRAGHAAVKKDVGAALSRVEQHTEALMSSVAEELQALRLSVNELVKASK
ncbi:MAG: hypothetical protein JSS57_04405 [Proteobacteria bacterium]|nr:hypothetical protein [Pseudomonadota bacterium]